MSETEPKIWVINLYLRPTTKWKFIVVWTLIFDWSLNQDWHPTSVILQFVENNVMLFDFESKISVLIGAVDQVFNFLDFYFKCIFQLKIN